MGTEAWGALPDTPALDPPLIEEAEVAVGLRKLLSTPRPRELREVTGEWDEQGMLQVVFRHTDGETEMVFTYGDGLTAVQAPALSYAGWLEPEDALTLVEAGLRGRAVQVEEHALGRRLGTAYVVERGDGGTLTIEEARGSRIRVGHRPSRLRRLLRLLPVSRTVERAAVSFERTPAVSALP